jgi:hypothetical protein
MTTYSQVFQQEVNRCTKKLLIGIHLITDRYSCTDRYSFRVYIFPFIFARNNTTHGDERAASDIKFCRKI